MKYTMIRGQKMVKTWKRSTTATQHARKAFKEEYPDKKCRNAYGCAPGFLVISEREACELIGIEPKMDRVSDKRFTFVLLDERGEKMEATIPIVTTTGRRKKGVSAQAVDIFTANINEPQETLYRLCDEAGINRNTARSAYRRWAEKLTRGAGRKLQDHTIYNDAETLSEKTGLSVERIQQLRANAQRCYLETRNGVTRPRYDSTLGKLWARLDELRKRWGVIPTWRVFMNNQDITEVENTVKHALKQYRKFHKVVKDENN